MKFLFAIIITFATVQTSYANIEAEYDFESGDRYEGFLRDRIDGNTCCSHSYNIVSSNEGDAPEARTGSEMARFELNASDPNVPFSSKRSEVSLSGLSLGLGKVRGEEEWYAFSLYLPDSYKSDSLHDLHAQWHGRADPGERNRSPVLGMYTRGSEWRIQQRSSATKIQTSNPNPETIWSAPYKTGVWTDFVVHVKWDYRSNGDGFTNIWMREGADEQWQQIVQDRGPNSYNDDGDIYFKAGIYKWDWDGGSPTLGITKRIVFLDAMKFATEGSAFDDVAAPNATSSGGTPTQCNAYLSNSTPITGFGTSYNLFSAAKELLLDASCSQSNFTLTAGNGENTTYIYETGYSWDGTSWSPFQFSGAKRNGVWFAEQAATTLQYQGSETYVVGYVCLYVNNEWKCGCQNRACAQPSWQVQVVSQ